MAISYSSCYWSYHFLPFFTKYLYDFVFYELYLYFSMHSVKSYCLYDTMLQSSHKISLKILFIKSDKRLLYKFENTFRKEDGKNYYLKHLQWLLVLKKILWACTLKYKNLWNTTQLSKKLHKCHFTNHSVIWKRCGKC